MIVQIASLLGAILVLFGYFASQVNWISEKTRLYQIINLLGAGILTVTAWHLQQYGFVLMNGAWYIISLFSLIRSFRQRDSQ